MLGPEAAKKLVKDELFPRWEQERDRLDKIDRWYRWEQEPIRLPLRATPEHKRLAQMAQVPWLGLVVTATAQAMHVGGARSAHAPAGTADAADLESISRAWRSWLANAMARRQVAVHRYMLAYGYGVVRVLPGEDPVPGRAQSVIRGVSPRKMYALWEDPAEDDWPQYTLHVVERKGYDEYLVKVLDDTAQHTLLVEESGTKVSYLDQPEIH